MATAPDEIRATVESFYLNSLEADLLACIALALADISEHLSEIREGLTRHGSRADVFRNHSQRSAISSIGAVHQRLSDGGGGR
jgi:hypothetical protein